jgi:PIN domain nuclease of toxin-antitoxin system
MLDTYTFLGDALGNSKPSNQAKEIIDLKENLYFSSVSLWEIVIKFKEPKESKKYHADPHPEPCHRAPRSGSLRDRSQNLDR